MKNLILVICVFAFFLNNVDSKELVSSPLSNITTFNSNGWQLLKTENGINIYLATYVGDDGSVYLNIKFENISNQDVKKYWTLKKGSVVFLEDAELIIKTSSTYEVDKTTMMIPFNTNDSLEDFEITLKNN
ncbi:MAG: hypothetical protein P1U41_09050 [Vicingaceae bacterium]|nr:hypothetical protein [Vicingaceae bacterium]